MAKLRAVLHGLAPDREKPGLREHFMKSCLLPAAAIIAGAVVLFAVYVLITMERGRLEAILFALALGIGLLLALWLTGERFIRSFTEQLLRLQNHAKRMAAGDHGVLTEKLRDDELGDLTESINALDGEIARSQAMQSEFISSVSHELRTPLTAIMGWAEALEYDEAIQGDSRRGIEIISKESGRLTKMVAELLDFTRIQGGRFTLNMETIDLASEVEDAVFTYRSLMEQEGVSLHYECDEETIPEIEADPERLKQVLLNVLDNAAKYGRTGKTIEVTLAAGEADDVVLRVRDHGPGIPPEELPHVKERFYKGSSKERGSGIGLAVCEEIVSRHGGTLLIENAPDGGVLVTVKLPVKQSN